jgi:hypothetical protein
LTGVAATRRRVPPAVLWGVVVGILQTASPLALWWVDPATVYAFGLVFIAAIYVGFAVADGRPRVIATESIVASIFVVLAAISVTESVWWVVVGLFGHGLKDLWQHRSHFVSTTRWWPPFCLVVDWTAAPLIAAAIIAGLGVD